MKSRPFTEAERTEVRRIRKAGRLGQLTMRDQERAAQLFEINATEYGEIGDEVVKEVDEMVRKGLA
jgi:hypothetical protein